MLVLDIMKMVKAINEEIEEEILKELANLEKITGKKFGDATNPLLVSVRSGARAINARYDGYSFKS